MRTVGLVVGVLMGLVGTAVFAESPKPVEGWMDPWMVATGMGGCAGVTTVPGEVSDLSPWFGPEDFVNQLRAKDLQVSTVTAQVQGRYVVKVLVPTRNVNVVFVPRSLCRLMIQEELDRSPRGLENTGREDVIQR